MKKNINKIANILHSMLSSEIGGKNHIVSKKSIYTNIPDNNSIELISYYDEFIDYYPNCELDTKQWFVTNIKKDWVMFDCGANIGYFSILFSRFAPEGHIYAFEPTDTYKMLLKNISHHRLNNITVIKEALGNKVGKKQEEIYRIWGREPERKIYPFTTIDQYLEDNNIERLDCIKIDVDSFDFEVLQGAKKSLLKFNPFVMVELNHALAKRNQNNMQALEWLMSIGYEQAMVFDDDNFLLKRDYSYGEKENLEMPMKLYFKF
jgi:FkbM family methyltransferase